MSLTLREATSATTPAPARPSRAGLRAPRRRWLWGPLIPLILLAAAFGLRALGFLTAVIDTDEGLYLVQAREWLRGGWPLVAVWDMHPVGAPAVFAAALVVFGETIAAARILGVLCVALAAWALFGAVQAGGGPRRLALGAAFIYIAHSLRLGGLATNTEILFAPLVVGAIALSLKALAEALRLGQAPGWGGLVTMGLAIGAAIAIKPVVVPEGCLAFAFYVFPALWRRVLPWPRAAAMAGAYAVLCLLPTLALGLAYAAKGQLPAFLDGAFLAPVRYTEERLGLEESAHRILVTVLTLLWPFVLSVIATLRWGGRSGTGARLTRTALLWFAVGSIAVAAPGFYYPHYFLIWLPALSILTALGAWAMVRRLPHPWRRRAFAALVAVVVIGSWRADATARVDRGIGLFTPDPVTQLAARIRQDLRPGETIFVANYHPALYFLTGAALPTRFVFPAHLTGAFPEVASTDMDQELARVLATRPRYIVVDRGWWPQLRDSAAQLLTEVLESDYTVVAEVPEERGPIELWQPK